MIEFFSENNKRFLANNFFRNKISSENVLQGPIYVSESPECLQFIWILRELHTDARSAKIIQEKHGRSAIISFSHSVPLVSFYTPESEMD